MPVTEVDSRSREAQVTAQWDAKFIAEKKIGKNEVLLRSLNSVDNPRGLGGSFSRSIAPGSPNIATARYGN